MFICTAEAPDIPAPDSVTVCMSSAASVMPQARAAIFLRHRDAGQPSCASAA